MIDSLLQDVNELFGNKAFLSIEDVTVLMNCSETVVYNWLRRKDPKKRPPRLLVGKEVRFPKREFAQWLAEET